jgi:serine/threonine-protein kinase
MGEAFPTGAVLGGRFRIIGLLGRGGMGEVYRADDLTLGQSVALKFLPPAVALDPERRQAFLREVRIAREVSHPNVCRVYDIGEMDGLHYLSMEYIDGEDLASLLRRIGRLPGDKATEIARQLCGGLGAAHERGVLHRDLKPANVMIDGRGRVRITDFGLAVLAADLGQGSAPAGTPAYMAPEQLAGGELSERTDVYALGLLLYEIYTGKPVFRGGSLAEIHRLHHETTPTRPSTLITDLDPAVERAILRCLEPDPRDRPFSAMAVSASLPGGDALAAAIAAGETPSPELVAASGAVGGLRPLWGWLCLAAIAVAVFGVARFNVAHMLFAQVPLPKAPAVLADRAQEILRAVGHTTPPGDTDHGLYTEEDLLDYYEEVVKAAPAEAAPAEAAPTENPWQPILRGELPAIRYWYRQSPETLIPIRPDGIVERDDPPLIVPGMVLVALDPEGRLLEFQAVPPDRSDAAAPAATGDSAGESRVPDWSPLFTAAGLDPTTFARTVPAWTPPMFADVRAAWKAPHPSLPRDSLTIEAAGFQGRPVFFQVTGPWRKPVHEEASSDPAWVRTSRRVELAIVIAMLIGAIVMALRNVRLNRGDRRTAFRLGAYIFLVSMAYWAVAAHHASDMSKGLGRFMIALGPALFYAGSTYVIYLALEPYVRRTAPHRLIAWSRLCAGKFNDPLVGRDVLIGLVAGGALAASIWLQLLPQWLGAPPRRPEAITLEPLFGVQRAIAALLNGQPAALFNGLFFLFMPLLLQVVFRKPTLSLWVLFILLLALFASRGSHPTTDWVPTLLMLSLVFLLLVRFGLLALTAAFFMMFSLGIAPLANNLSSWYASSAIVMVAVVCALALYAFRVALAGRSPFSGLLRD